MTARDRAGGMPQANAVACGMLGSSDAADVQRAMATGRSSASSMLADPGASIADLPLDGPSR